MKKVILAAIITAFSATVVAAEGLLNLGVSGEVEYSVENENLTMEAGPDLFIGGFGIRPTVYGSINSESVLTLDGVGVEATYGLTKSITMYGELHADKDFGYEDLIVGARFAF